MTKSSEPEYKHMEVCVCVLHLQCDPASVSGRCVRDGGLEGEGDLVSCQVKVRV